MTLFRSLSLCLILALPFLGTFGWFTGRMVAVRQEASRVLKDDHRLEPLHRLSFLVDEVDRMVEWEHSREFKYRGEMYDIVRTEMHGDSIAYWCYHDVKETSLRREIGKWMSRVIRQPIDGSPSPVQQLRHFFATLFPPDTPAGMAVGLPFTSNSPWWPDSGPFRHLAQRPPSPPPRMG